MKKIISFGALLLFSKMLWAGPISPALGNPILNQNAPQSGAVLNIASGTIAHLNVTQINGSNYPPASGGYLHGLGELEFEALSVEQPRQGIVALEEIRAKLGILPTCRLADKLGLA